MTIEAWHRAFDEANSRSNLHVDVVFGTARVGGEPESPVRFRLSVRSAEVVVVVPPHEPVAVDPSSVSRDATAPSGKISEKTQKRSRRDGSARVAGSLKGLLFGFSGSQSATLSSDRIVETEQEYTPINVKQSKTEDDHYRWIVSASNDEVLDGRPWDAKSKPRLVLVDTRQRKTRTMPPSVRVEVRCRREDLVIEDISIKDKDVWDQVRQEKGFKNKLIAAEAFIRTKLFEDGLVVNNLEESFAQVVLADASATPAAEAE